MDALRNDLNRFYTSKKAIVAFNIQNSYQFDALVKAVKLSKLPVIAQFSSSYIDYFQNYYNFEKYIHKYSNIPLYFHLDHCSDVLLINKCIEYGFHGVMFDGSSLPIEENIKGTNIVYEYANTKGVCVEAELGSIIGVEDGSGTKNGNYFSLEEFELFVRKAKFDILALGIGNAHGFYKTTSEVKLNLLNKATEIKNDLKHVLHGATGLSDELILEAINLGTVKINFSTELKAKTHKVIQEYVDSKKIFDEKEFRKLHIDRLMPFFIEIINKFSIK